MNENNQVAASPGNSHNQALLRAARPGVLLSIPSSLSEGALPCELHSPSWLITPGSHPYSCRPLKPLRYLVQVCKRCASGGTADCHCASRGPHGRAARSVGLDCGLEGESVSSRDHVASVAWWVFEDVFVPWGSCFCGVGRLEFATILSRGANVD